MKAALLAVSVAVLSVACSSGPSSWSLDRPASTFGSVGAAAQQASMLIGQSGGEVSTPRGSGVSIPIGSLSAEAWIQVEAVSDAPAPTEGAPVGQTLLLGPEGQTFAQPVTVTVEIDPTKLLPGESVSDVVIFTSPKASPSFSALETTVVDATHVSAKTTHFSYFVPVHGTTIAGIALANVGKGACSRNSKGGRDFESSCTGNGGSPEYWCADFARWVWAQVGANVSGLTAGAGSFYVYGEDHGTLHHGNPLVGDAVVFHYQGNGYADHVAIVTKVDSNGTIETVSGDWGGASGTEAEFSSTSHVVLNAPAYGDRVGTTPATMNMVISGYISPAGLGPSLPEGEYISTAKEIGESAYIGDWKDSEGYVLGYFVPGAKIYAKYVTDHSVYGLITNSGYGGWDDGHHCGWVPLGKGVHVEGSGKSSPVAKSCPAWDNDFSLAHEKNPSDDKVFRTGSFVVSGGAVQPAVVLPTCSDFTVYGNYEPLTHTFSDPDGKEEAHRGTLKNLADPKDPCKAPSSPSGWTPYVSASGIKANKGYCGFGTRFVSADGYAVEIKDTERSGKSFTAFGFMHADCIAGSQVGDPAGVWPPAKSSCGTLEPGHSLGTVQEITSCNRQYWLEVSADGTVVLVHLDVGQVWDIAGVSGDRLDMQADGNLVLYKGKEALWASKTSGHPGAYLSLQDDGNLVIYYGSTPIWTR
jgi:hypothetical protein